MLIRSRIERPNAPIELGDRTYFFRPLTGTSGPHVAEVTDEAHIARLLSIAECYERFELPSLQRATEPPVVATEPPEPLTGGQLEKLERAKALRSLPVAELRAQLQQIQDAELLTMLLTLEREATAPPPRRTVVDIVAARLNAVTAQ